VAFAVERTMTETEGGWADRALKAEAREAELRAALEPVNRALETLMDEVTHKKATDWGLVNETAVMVTRALASGSTLAAEVIKAAEAYNDLPPHHGDALRITLEECHALGRIEKAVDAWRRGGGQ